VKCCLSENLIKNSVPKVFTGDWSGRHLFLACSKIPDSQKEAGTQHKPHCLCKQFRHSEPLLSVLEMSFLEQIVTRALFLRSSLFGVAVSGCLMLFCLRFVFFEKKKKGFVSVNLRNPSA